MINVDSTLKAKHFRDLFRESLKLTTRTVSVKTLLSERNLKRINYSPYYQRNYVWDNVKQTFFIESVILGTEIPPLILFKSGIKIEVIDGRQRFETLKRFKENDFSLSINGLQELPSLSRITFNKLSAENKDIFLNANIRVFEFEVINQPNIDIDLVDRIKKEIFRRYNTGITPLTREELDNAKYDDDDFSDLFRKELKENVNLFRTFNACFFPKTNITDDLDVDNQITKNIDFIRRFRILYNFPISKYARGSDRTEIIDLLYDFAKNNTDDAKNEYANFKLILLDVLNLYVQLSESSTLKNKLIYECILWAATILDKEGIKFSYETQTFKSHYTNNIEKYAEDGSHYYSNIITRFEDTGAFFSKLFGVNYSIYIRSEAFKSKISNLKQTEVDAAKSIQELTSLRLHKPNPISIPIDEIRNDLKTSRYLLRPSYQRQEKINIIKASSIIESLLLGINLPPIFIFKRNSGIKEVVDGQQRLLAIIGFLGEQFYNEDEKLTYSKNNNFKLKGLKILTEFEGKNFTSLPPSEQDKILDFVIDVIIIEEAVNNSFDPVDLFIRLNYKPYPIKNNSFEMWNSIVNYDVINKIKSEVFESHKNWFYLRERMEGKPDRMENEELITILAYLSYNDMESLKDGVIGFFARQDRITCRLKDKKGLGDFLINLDNAITIKHKFLLAIDKTNHLIKVFGELFGGSPNKEQLNDFLNVRNSQTFRRTLQDFYVIWLLLDRINDRYFNTQQNEILQDIRGLLAILRNTENVNVDEHYLEFFYSRVDALRLKYT